jgi:hypothetical protein
MKKGDNHRPIRVAATAIPRQQIPTILFPKNALTRLLPDNLGEADKKGEDQ